MFERASTTMREKVRILPYVTTVHAEGEMNTAVVQPEASRVNCAAMLRGGFDG